MSTGLKANSDGSAAIQVGGSDAITITSGLNATFAGTVTSPTGTLYPLVSGTAIASTSGTSIDFTGIPSTAKRITVMFNGVSTNGTSVPIIQLGTSSGIEISGYTGATSEIGNAVATATNITSSTGIQIQGGYAATIFITGNLVLNLLGSNLWVANGAVFRVGVANTTTVIGAKTTASTLDRVRITTVNGTDTFDAGSINILWE